MQNRRQFMKTTAVGLSAAAVAANGFAGQSKKPNIVYILADQLRYQSCGYAGDVLARTPNLDRLAKQSVNFQQAISSMPVCSAYRASLFTGKYTTSTGMVINELRMNPNQRCLGHCLTDAGYNTGYIGKWHLYANELGNHFDPKNSFVPRGPHRLGFDGYWAAYNFHHQYYGENSYYHTESPEKIHYGDGVFEPDAQTDRAISYVKKARQSDKPFAMVLSYGTPHDPWEIRNVPKENYAHFKDVEFPIPPNYSDELDPYGDAWSNIRKSPETIRDWKRVYYAMTENLDWNVGRLMNALEEMGLADNTIVVFTSDHGEMWGGHGRMKKNIFYDEAARVPFLIRWPKKIPAGLVSDACLNTVDIMPTLLGLANLEIPDSVEGMDLSAVACGENGAPEPEHALLMNTGACAAWENGHEWRALRDKRYTYAVFRADRQEMLFDNQTDPYQMKNLAYDGNHQSLMDKYRTALQKEMHSINDNFEECTYYRDNWMDGDRNIIRSAKGNF